MITFEIEINLEFDKLYKNCSIKKSLLFYNTSTPYNSLVPPPTTLSTRAITVPMPPSNSTVLLPIA